jgi:hypothetical protein
MILYRSNASVSYENCCFVRPQLADPGAASAGIEHRHRRFLAEQPRRGLDRPRLQLVEALDIVYLFFQVDPLLDWWLYVIVRPRELLAPVYGRFTEGFDTRDLNKSQKVQIAIISKAGKSLSK